MSRAFSRMTWANSFHCGSSAGVIRNCACSSLMRPSTRSSAFLPATGWPAIGEASAAGGGGVVPCAAADCDCAMAAGAHKSAAIAIGAAPLNGINLIRLLQK